MNGFHTIKATLNKTLVSPILLSRKIFALETSFSTTASASFPLTSLQCGRLLQTITNSRSIQLGKQLHANVVSSGVIIDNTYLLTKLAALYAACGHMFDARKIFDSVVLRSSFLWNVMIGGYASNGMGIDSIVLYREMLAFGKQPDNYTYPFVLMACGDLSLLDVGRKVHCEVVVLGYESNTYVGNSLLSMYLKFGELDLAQKVFDKLPERDLTSWNTIISGYTKNGHPEKALSAFIDMVASGERLNRATLLGVLPACADLMWSKQGKEIHAYILRNCIEFNVYLTNSLIDVYVNSDFVEGARQLFMRMNGRDVVSWNSMISGCARQGDALESLRLFHRMNSDGVDPDLVTFVVVLGACDKIAALQSGRSLHGYLVKLGLDVKIPVGTSLLDMYAKCGSLSSSCRIFNEMPEKNLILWSAMISGYGLHGRGKDAIFSFSQMKKKDIIPDEITFTSILSACGHSGLVDEGKEIFDQMSTEYSITPNNGHYACMVDLLGRAGKLDEAYQLIRSMKVQPDFDVWAALLSASRFHHNVKLAEVAAENAFLLKPKGIGHYISLSNIYAVERRWADVERVRANLRQNGLRKPPGCSFVELGFSIHRFIVGDKFHPQSTSIYEKLDYLREKLRKLGHTSDTSQVLYDVAEHVKERMLWDHSERLAIAFALLNTSSEKIIRITKNLRVCLDCHTTMKLISKLERRKIIVRDSRRFHHFQHGYCSCGDYW